MLSVEVEPFQVGDLVKYIYYDWEITGAGRTDNAERSNIAFVLDIVTDPDEKQVDLFPKILIYDARLRRTILTHAYNIEFISRAT